MRLPTDWLRTIIAIEGVAARVGDMMGKLAMEALATLDQVAFIRSASVYLPRSQGFRRIRGLNHAG